MGVDVNVQGCSARTPLHCATFEGHIEIVELLLIHGASMEITDALEETPLHKAATRGHYKVLEILLTKTLCNLNCQNVLGSTALHQAMEHGYEECTKLLLEKGADPAIQDFFGYPPIFMVRKTLLTEIDQ
eukprot:TRINITY_DN11845_c0_g1_i1.p1 TRINITY_DN11845_c0_g1~~TRINITY_DN11845_c0_g1_i1.p1  ORF type:complete len:130 (+),score=20.51 TRINITY_DN11845_c0_g1_i1:189-578(+)